MSDEALGFKKGRVVNNRWEVVEKLGAGACGAVFKVQDKNFKKGKFMAAMKVEKRSDEEEAVLKLEVAVLKKLKNSRYAIRLLDAAKRPKYNFIVITMCGKDLMSLRKMVEEGFTESTILRIALNSLYAIKELHETGYVHRDIKPGNIMNGLVGIEKRIMFLIDFGMARSFICANGKHTEIRKQRTTVLLRGTLRYCSLNVHKRLEQGRVDDLWSWIYAMCELYGGLPWNRLKKEEDVIVEKEKLTDQKVFEYCPAVFIRIAGYLRTLKYESRPDYRKLYDMLLSFLRMAGYSLQEAFDWETEDDSAAIVTAVEYSERERKTMKKLPDDEVDFLIYPHLHPSVFSKNVLGI